MVVEYINSSHEHGSKTKKRYRYPPYNEKMTVRPVFYLFWYLRDKLNTGKCFGYFLKINSHA